MADPIREIDSFGVSIFDHKFLRPEHVPPSQWTDFWEGLAQLHDDDEAAYDDGYNNGFEEGFTEGHDQGFEEGQEMGEKKGRQDLGREVTVFLNPKIPTTELEG